MKALIIDDEISTRESIKLLANFKQFGIDEVLEAKNGFEGYQLIEKYNPELIFLDMNMPIMDGPALLDVINGDISGKIIVVSSYTDFNIPKQQ